MNRLRECGFDLAAVGVGFSNFIIFVIIALRGAASVWEPNPYILGAELLVSASFIFWGIDRLVSDWFQKE